MTIDAIVTVIAIGTATVTGTAAAGEMHHGIAVEVGAQADIETTTGTEREIHTVVETVR